MGPAQLQLHEKIRHYTSFACVRVYESVCVVYVHALQCAPRPFLLSELQLRAKLMYIVTIAFCHQHLLTETNVVLFLIFE